MQGKLFPSLVVCVLALAPAAHAAEPRNCFWGVKEEPNAVNVAYPDEGANYWGGNVTLPPGGELILRGEFPHTRYMSFNVYDHRAAPTDAIADWEIAPDGDSANPFLPGARRDAANRSYTVRVVAGVPPPERDPNTIYLSVGGSASQAGAIIYRTYVPDQGLGEAGGVALPSVALRLADGTELSQDASCDFLDAVAPPNAINDTYASSEGITREGTAGEAKNPIEWYAFFNTLETATRRFKGTPVRDLLVDEDDRSGGFFSNVHNAYASAYTSRGLGPVLVLEGRAPTFPRTRDGRPVMGTGQVRYWSLCQNETRSTRFVDCLVDDDAIVGADGRYTVVISTPGQRPANATEDCGVTWLAWGAAPDTNLILRHMLPSPDFAQAIQNAERPDSVEEQSGEYLPAGVHMQREEFEARGCPPS